jgi:hypothetical protein
MAMEMYLPPVITRLTMDLAPFEAKIAKAKALMDTLHSDVSFNVDANTKLAVAKIDALSAQVTALAKSNPTVNVNANTTAAAAKIAALGSAATAVGQRTPTVNTRARGTIFGFQPYGIWGAIAALGSAHVPLYANAAQVALNAVSQTLRGTDAQMPSFIGHLIGYASGWHMAAEAVIEFTAVWVPATIAVAAFAAAAYPTGKAIYNQLMDMQKASGATGQSFKSLATSGASVTQAVKPSVLEGFGEILYTVQKNSGTLAPVLAGIGGDFDQIIARASAAMNGTGQFMQSGAGDAKQLMTAFGNLFGILGNLMRSVPGYAAVLLQFGTDTLGFGERVTGALEPVIAVFLKLHGAVFYGGLFGTAVAYAFSKIVAGALGATKALIGFAASTSLIADDGFIANGLLAIGSSLEEVGSAPVLAGLGLAAGAIAAVVMYMRAGKTAASELGSSMQQALQSVSVDKLQSLLSSDRVTNAQQLAVAQNSLAQAQSAYNAALAAEPDIRGFQPVAQQQALQAARSAVAGYAANGNQLNQQQANLLANLNAVHKAFEVGLPEALTLADQAQVTNSQLLGSGSENLAEITALVGGYIAQMRVMTTGTGTLNTALNALKVTTSSQYTDIQDVTSAYSTWIGIVTGGDSAFTTFEQGQNTLISDLKSGGATVETTLGKISDKFTTVKSSLDGTSASALAARQAFDSQISAAVTLYNSLATMAAVSGSSAVAQNALYQAGKDVVAQLLPLAAGSSEATQQVYALAQIAGYAGNSSFASLSKWLGNTKNSEQDLDKQQQILTVTTSNLTQADKNLSSGLQGQVTQAMVNAIANTSQLNSSTSGLASAFTTAKGKIGSAVQQMGDKYVQTLLQMGFLNSQIEGSLAAFANSYLHNSSEAQKWADQTVQAVERIKNAMNGIQSKTVLINVQAIMGQISSGSYTPVGVTPLPPVNKVVPRVKAYASGTPGAQSGWGWVGEAGPELVRFRGGETVVPSSVARGYAGGTDDFEIHSHIYLDGRELSQEMAKRATQRQRRTGHTGYGKRTR